MARTTRLNIMVDDKIKYTLQTYAESMGLTLSALCAYVLGDFVRREERILNPVMEAAQNAVMDYAKMAMSTKSEASLDMEQDKP